MAENKNDKERSVEERLKALYQLQTYLSEIDKIKILRGELPNEVKDLEDEIVRFQTRISKFNDEIEEARNLISQRNAEIADRRQKIEKYEEQINNVRNNREFTFLEKEKEFESLQIELAEKHIRDAQARMQARTEDIQRTETELDDQRHILEEKREELDNIVSETRQEEEEIRQKAKDVEPLIDDYTLAAFKRIRKNARNGLGVVTVQRDACGGCFNRIPPQRQLEIKMHKKIIVCEYCGRIMIDGPLVGIQEEVKEEPKKTRAKKVTRKSASAE